MANVEFTQLPPVSAALMADINCVVQGGVSSQETNQQVFNLFLANTILNFAGNPNGNVAGTQYQLCWDSTHDILYVCTTTGSAVAAVWTQSSVGDFPLSITNGGTGQSSVTISPTASSWAGWDANKNFSANSFIPAYATTATAATTTTLTVGSAFLQFFTGSTTQTVLMPVVGTLVLGQQFQLVNNSSSNVTVQSSGGNTIVTMTANTITTLTVVSISGTTAASWYYDFVNKVESVGTVVSVSTAGLATGGPITTTGTVTVTAALQADQQTATSTTTVVTPAVQQFHPSAVKAYAVYSDAGLIFSGAYNVSSITNSATGVDKVNFTVQPSSVQNLAFSYGMGSVGATYGSSAATTGITSTSYIGTFTDVIAANLNISLMVSWLS